MSARARSAPYALVVQHDAADTPGAIARELAAKQIALRDVRAYAGDAVPESIGEASALVVMGAPMSVSESTRYPFVEVERRLIASAIERRVPVLGVCFGSQLLASVLGGTVARAREKEIGWFDVERVEGPGAGGDPLFDGVPRTFMPFHWHEDAIALPPGATLLARSRVTPVQAFRAGRAEDAVYGLQFHLESDAAMVRGMVRSFGDELREAGVDETRVLAETEVRMAEQARLAALIFGRWAARVAAPPHR